MPKPEYSNKISKLLSGIQEDNSLLNPLETAVSNLSYSWECDANGLYTFCSNEVIDLLGFSLNDIIGNPLLSIGLPVSEQSKLRSALLSETFPCDVELVLTTKNRKNLKTRWNLFKLLDNKNQLTGYKGVVLFLDKPIQTGELIEPTIEKPIEMPTKPDEPIVEMDSSQSEVQTGMLPEIELEDQKDVEKTTPVVRATGKKREVKPKTAKKPNVTTSPLKAIQTAPLPPIFSSIPPAPVSEIKGLAENFAGLALTDGEFKPSGTVWSKQSELSLLHNETISQSGSSDAPAVIVTPLKMRDQQSAVIEIIHDSSSRKWTQEDLSLIHI
jgi:hypothetical protein